MDVERIYNKIQIVDENDVLLGVASYGDATKNGDIKRVSRIMVVNASGQFLIQRRSQHISKPLLLDNSAAGHVDEGENYEIAAIRELSEELGITRYPLEEVVVSYRTPEFFMALYRVVVPDDVSVVIDPREVSEVFWLTADELDLLLIENRDECRDILVEIWMNFKHKLIQ